jgi:acetolactate synthase-1/2/3 large subunit
MPRMNGAQAFIGSLYREGVRVVFGIPGAGQYDLIDAIYNEPGIRYISTRNEQATSYMADGYARVTGEVGTLLVVPGPGLFNASAGLATAHAASSRVLTVTGGGGKISPDDPEGEIGWLYPITKWRKRVGSPDEAPAVVHEAFRQLATGRPRPIALEIERSTQAGEADVDLLEKENYPPEEPDGEAIQRAAQLLTAASSPMIMAGAGVVRSGASDDLRRLAEHLQAPVITTRSGKGTLSDRHPLSLGMAERGYQPLRDRMDGSDVLLSVGSRQNFANRPGDQTVIRIDVDESEFSNGDDGLVPIVGDARQSLEALLEAVAATTPARARSESDASAIREFREKRFDPESQLQPQGAMMQAIREAIPDDGILVHGMTQLGYYSRNYYPVYEPGAYLTPSRHGTLGSAFPLALGAKVGMPDRAVVAISGDGGFLYNSQELATAVQYGINVVTIVFNDNAYGNVMRAQVEDYHGHVLGTRLHNPDFADLARSYGARGLKAADAGELNELLREALDVDAPTVIEVPVGTMEREF